MDANHLVLMHYMNGYLVVDLSMVRVIKMLGYVTTVVPLSFNNVLVPANSADVRVYVEHVYIISVKNIYIMQERIVGKVNDFIQLLDVVFRMLVRFVCGDLGELTLPFITVISCIIDVEEAGMEVLAL